MSAHEIREPLVEHLSLHLCARQVEAHKVATLDQRPQIVAYGIPQVEGIETFHKRQEAQRRPPPAQGEFLDMQRPQQ